MVNSILWLPWLTFFRAFSSVVMQIPGLNSQVGARSALFKSSCHCVVLSSFCCYCVVLLFVLFCYYGVFYVLIVCTVTLPPGVNPIAVDKYIYLYYTGIFNGPWRAKFHFPEKQTPAAQPVTLNLPTDMSTAIRWSCLFHNVLPSLPSRYINITMYVTKLLFGKRLLTRIFRRKRVEITGEWRRLH